MRTERIRQRSPQVQKTAHAESGEFSLSSRRGFLVGALSLIAAPALVRASSIMPVKAWAEPGLLLPDWVDPFQPDEPKFLLRFVKAKFINLDGSHESYWRFVERVPGPNQSPLLSEGRLPEVSRWKTTAGPERLCASAPVSFPQRSPPVVQDHQRALPMLGGRV